MQASKLIRCHSCLQILLIYAKSTDRRTSHVETEVCCECWLKLAVLNNDVPLYCGLKVWSILIVWEDHSEVHWFVFGKRKHLSQFALYILINKMLLYICTSNSHSKVLLICAFIFITKGADYQHLLCMHVLFMYNWKEALTVYSSDS